VSLDTSDKRQATRLERERIAEAQNSGTLSSLDCAGVTVEHSAEMYLSKRAALVSASTIRLERDALKPITRHIGSLFIGRIMPETLTSYVTARKSEGIGNRTINMEIGVLRKILKRWKLWGALSEHYKALPEPRDIGRALSPSEESRLFAVASSRPEWTVAFCASLIAANTTAGGCELRNLRLKDVELSTRTLFVKVGKNRFRVRAIPLNQTATWAVTRLLERAALLGSVSPEHYLLPKRISGELYDPSQPASRWAWRTAWRKLTEQAGLNRLRPHDLRHHAITKLAESQASEQTIMAIAWHVSREMLEHYSHIRLEAKRKALESLDNVTFLAQIQRRALPGGEPSKSQTPESVQAELVGTGRFELPTPRTPSECSTRLSHVPTGR
jgi:integrase